MQQDALTRDNVRSVCSLIVAPWARDPV